MNNDYFLKFKKIYYIYNELFLVSYFIWNIRYNDYIDDIYYIENIYYINIDFLFIFVDFYINYFLFW